MIVAPVWIHAMSPPFADGTLSYRLRASAREEAVDGKRHAKRLPRPHPRCGLRRRSRLDTVGEVRDLGNPRVASLDGERLHRPDRRMESQEPLHVAADVAAVLGRARRKPWSSTPRSPSTRIPVENGYEAGMAMLPSTTPEAPPSYSTTASTWPGCGCRKFGFAWVPAHSGGGGRSFDTPTPPVGYSPC